MNPLVELNLAVILFLPWFVILGALFWFCPRPARRRGARTAFDIAALALALAASVLATRWGLALGAGHPSAGAIWPQVLASLVAYGAFVLVLLVAWPLRTRVLRGAGRDGSARA